MEKEYLKQKAFLKKAIICSFVSSISILTLAFMKLEDTVFIIIFPSVFWLGLIAEQVFWLKSNKIRKSIIKSSKKTKEESGKAGVVTFFKNNHGKMADIVFLISLVTLIISAITNVIPFQVQMCVLFILVLSFRMHCIFNGKNYTFEKKG